MTAIDKAAPPASASPGRRLGWLGLVAVLAAVGVLANLGAWRAALDPSGGLEGLWRTMGTVKVPDRPGVAPAFPPELRAEEGRKLTLTGVVFVPPGAVRDGAVAWCVLQPKSRYGCCGLSCDPRPELSVYVDCSAAPWRADGKTQVLASVEGTLRLEKDASSWCLYGLDAAVVRPEGP